MKVKITIICLIVLQLVTLFFLGRAMFHNFIWDYEATKHARRAGGLEAARDYRRGFRRVLAAKAIDTSAENYSGPAYDSYQLLPTKGKQDGVELWHIVQAPELSRPHEITLTNYVDAYNREMRVRIDHPDWFTPEGDRIPRKR